MFKSIQKEIKILSFSFFFIFVGFGGVQQYVTTFFSQLGFVNVGFNSLLILYIFFTLSNPLGAIVVSKYGAKKSMMVGALTYFLYIISILSKSMSVIYIGSALIGIGAAILWIAQNTYIISASSKKSYGTNTGFFSSIFAFGSAAGILILGFVVSKLSFRPSFLVFSMFPIFGMFMQAKLKDIRTEKKTNNFGLVKKSIKSPTGIMLSIIGFSFMLIVGLVIGILPLEINRIFGNEKYIGILSSLFFALPIFAYLFGRLSDMMGRKFIIILIHVVSLVGLFLLYFSTKWYLIVGVFLLAVNYGAFLTTNSALVGDVSTKKNIEFIAALFWIFRNLGIVVTLFIPTVMSIDKVYIVAISVTIISLVTTSLLFRKSFKEIRKKLELEIS